MARRLCGSLRISIEYSFGSYRGNIHIPGVGNWRFADLRPPYRDDPTSSDAYDRAAEDAVSFGSYYTSDNRPVDELPEWAPPPHIADAISEEMTHSPDYVRLFPVIPGVYIGDTAVVCRSFKAQEKYYAEAERVLSKPFRPRLTLIQGGATA